MRKSLVVVLVAALVGACAGILAKWRELERALDQIDDPDLRAGLDARVAELKAEYQVIVANIVGDHEPPSPGTPEPAFLTS